MYVHMQATWGAPPPCTSVCLSVSSKEAFYMSDIFSEGVCLVEKKDFEVDAVLKDFFRPLS